MNIEPVSQFRERFEFVVRNPLRPSKFVSSTKQARRNVRAFVDFAADKPYEHEFTITILFVENQSKYLLRMIWSAVTSAAFLSAESEAPTGRRTPQLAAGEGVEPSSSSSKPEVLPVTPSRRRGFKFQVPKFQVRLSIKIET